MNILLSWSAIPIPGYSEVQVFAIGSLGVGEKYLVMAEKDTHVTVKKYKILLFVLELKKKMTRLIIIIIILVFTFVKFK